jgi:ABC-2 type transport system permease protein
LVLAPEPGQAVAVGVGAAVAGTAYCAAFVMLSAINRHGMVTGLIYALVFEGLLASWLTGLRYLSVSAFGRRIAEGLDDSLSLVAGNLPLTFAWLASLVVTVAGAYVAGLRLSRFQLKGDE